MIIALKTTSECQKLCDNCQNRDWMISKRGYQLSLRKIQQFIDMSKQTNRHWRAVYLTGGDPLLWKHIEEGTKLLKESGICSKLIVCTNGLHIEPSTVGFVEKFINNLHELRIYKHPDNKDNIWLANEYFGDVVNSYGDKVVKIK